MLTVRQDRVCKAEQDMRVCKVEQDMLCPSAEAALFAPSQSRECKCQRGQLGHLGHSI